MCVLLLEKCLATNEQSFGTKQTSLTDQFKASLRDGDISTEIARNGGDRCHLTVELENQSTAAFCLLRAVLFVSAWDIPDRCTTHWDLAVA